MHKNAIHMKVLKGLVKGAREKSLKSRYGRSKKMKKSKMKGGGY